MRWASTGPPACRRISSAGQGSGILYLRRATPFHQLLLGGGQEMQKRAGTENVPGIVGTGVALERAATGIRERAARVRTLRGPSPDARRRHQRHYRERLPAIVRPQ